MKQLSIIILAVIAFSTNCMAQDRNNAAPAQLATKSKEIKSALYWQQDRKQGNGKAAKTRHSFILARVLLSIISTAYSSESMQDDDTFFVISKNTAGVTLFYKRNGLYHE